MGCDRVIWNAKVDESNYYRKFALKFCPCEHYYATQDQSYSQFKSSELTPYLSQVPSQVLRNAAVRWYQTLQKAIKGLCGFPKRKRKGNHASVYLTRELFRFEKAGKGYRLFIGTPKFPMGELRFSPHRSFKIPNSITVTHHNGRFYLSFGYENNTKCLTLQQQFDRLRGMDTDTLTQGLVGVDMGVTIPACSELANFDYSPSQKAHFKQADKKAKHLQRRLSKQRRMAKIKGQPPSKRSNRTQQRLNAQHGRKANIRQDFAHKTSRQLVDSATLGLVMEKLNIKGLPNALRRCVMSMVATYLTRRKPKLRLTVRCCRWVCTKYDYLANTKHCLKTRQCSLSTPLIPVKNVQYADTFTQPIVLRKVSLCVPVVATLTTPITMRQS